MAVQEASFQHMVAEQSAEDKQKLEMLASEQETKVHMQRQEHEELLALQRQSMIAAHTAKEELEVKRINAEILERERTQQDTKLAQVRAELDAQLEQLQREASDAAAVHTAQMEQQAVEAMEALREKRAAAEVAAEEELVAEVSAARQRNEEQLVVLRAEAAAQLERHRSAIQQEEQQALEELRAAKQAHEDKLQALVVSAKQRAEVTSAALQQQAEEQHTLDLQRQKIKHEQVLTDLRNINAAEIVKAQQTEAAKLAAVQVQYDSGTNTTVLPGTTFAKLNDLVLQEEVARTHAVELEQTERSQQHALETAMRLLQVRGTVFSCSEHVAATTSDACSYCVCFSCWRPHWRAFAYQLNNVACVLWSCRRSTTSSVRACKRSWRYRSQQITRQRSRQ
jgi:hypothetical protein